MRKSYLLPYIGYFLLSYFIFFCVAAYIPIEFPSMLILAIVPSLFTSHFLAIRKEMKLEQQIKYENDEFNPNLYGFGGWLYLLAIQMIVNFIQQVANIGNLIEMINAGSYNDLYSQSNIYGYYFWLSLAFSLAMVILIVLTGISALKQKKSFIRLALSYQIAVLLFSLMTYYFEVRLNIPSNVIYFVVTWIGFLLWGSYLKKSKRVKQTFIN